MPASVHSDDQPMEDAALPQEEEQEQEDELDPEEDFAEYDKDKIHIVCYLMLNLSSTWTVFI